MVCRVYLSYLNLDIQKPVETKNIVPPSTQVWASSILGMTLLRLWVGRDFYRCC